MPTGYRNYLSLKHEHKTVPYGGTGVLREDGDANYGFKNLKADSRLIDAIPELQKDPALRELVRVVNAPETGVMTIGCVSDHYEERGRFRHAGYVEFAFNSKSQIADAAHYFRVFIEFEKFLEQRDFAVKVEFNWSIQPATFVDERVSGYTCTIYLNTYFVESEAMAMAGWAETLRVLGQHLGAIPATRVDFIYSV